MTKDKLIEIIRQERIIELSFEGHYRWDMARWKELEHVLGHNPSALNTDGVSDEDFFRPVVVDRAWKFTSPTHYLLPCGKTVNGRRAKKETPSETPSASA